MSKAVLPKEYKPLFSNDYLYYVYYGGRGGGKTENIAQYLVIEASRNTHRILCLRESSKSIDESVKASIEKWINLLGLDDKFLVTSTSVKSLLTGSEFIFAGMKSHNAVKIKSISAISIVWLEEAEAFSKKSWQLLVPSVTRVEQPKIIISFNPDKPDDIIYQTFVANTPPKQSLVCKVNCYDNPFFKGTTLESVMLDDKERLPVEEFKHIWEGELAKYTEGSLFKEADLTPKDYELNAFSKIIIACDPATTDKNTSNEYGIIVLGKLPNGLVVILDDLSKNCSPFEFAQTVLNAKELYNTNNVVVEVNNGGDFIKALLLENDAFLSIKEVRAGSDKMHRALPVANLFATRKIAFNKKLEKLERQMRLMTDKGFLGSRGESPDRLDAMVWGVYDLFNIKAKETLHTLFNPNYFERDISSFMLETSNLTYLTTEKTEIVGFTLNIWSSLSTLVIEITDSFVFNDFRECEYLGNDNYLCYVENTPLNEFLKLYNNTMPFESKAPKASNEQALLILPTIKERKVIFSDNCVCRHYGGLLQNILLNELLEFNYENTERCKLLKLFTHALVSIFKLG